MCNDYAFQNTDILKEQSFFAIYNDAVKYLKNNKYGISRYELKNKKFIQSFYKNLISVPGFFLSSIKNKPSSELHLRLGNLSVNVKNSVELKNIIELYSRKQNKKINIKKHPKKEVLYA